MPSKKQKAKRKKGIFKMSLEDLEGLELKQTKQTKYMKMPPLRAWELYYEHIDNKKTYIELGHEHGVTGAKIRSLVQKVQKYLKYGNTRILTLEEVNKKLKEVFDIQLYM